MNTFFSEFHGFQYQRENSPESEFQRLQELRHWKEGSKTYKRNRSAFLAALASQSRSPVHRFFVETYRFLEYEPTANPRLEFDRLAKARKWNPNNRPYKQAKKAFDREFQMEFGADVLDFFDAYADGGFVYNPRGGTVEQLHAMADHYNWAWNSQEWFQARNNFYDAIEADFNGTFGRDDDDGGAVNMDGWLFLCKVLGVDGSSAETPEECRTMVKDKIVNIYDILEYARDGMPEYKPLKFFPTVKELGVYSYSSVPSKVYPQDRAEKGALKFLLQEIKDCKKKKKPDGDAEGENGGSGPEGVRTGVAAKKKRKKKNAGGNRARGDGGTGHEGVRTEVIAGGETNTAGKSTTPAVVGPAHVEEQ